MDTEQLSKPADPRASRPRRRLILIGPTPPPIHGSAFATLHLIEAVDRAGALAGHLETGEDDRPVFNTGVFDPTNVYLGVKHVLVLLSLLVRHHDADVHVPISQNRWGFARDSIFIRLAHLARRRVVAHLYGGMFGDFYASRRGLERRWVEGTFARVDEAWVETPNRATIFRGLLPDDRVSVLENTADDMGPPESEPGREEGPLRILFLANLIEGKGHDDLLAALELLAERGTGGIELRLIGEVTPEEAERVRARAAALQPAGIDVELRGTVMGEEKREQYRWADALALPSRYPPEGQPLVLLEAMSAGLPVIGSDHSGIPHTVLDGEQGLIVPKGDVAAIAAAIERLRTDPELLAALGEGGRRRFLDRYASASFDRRVAGLLDARTAAPAR